MTSGYFPLHGESDYRTAIDRVIALAEREIRIFDTDLRGMCLETPARIATLTRFIADDASRRIAIVVHDPDPLRLAMPRFLDMLNRHGHAIELRQSPDDLRQLADCHVLADSHTGVRRFHAKQPRGALITGDHDDISPWWQRFEQLWELSQPCPLVAAVGL